MVPWAGAAQTGLAADNQPTATRAVRANHAAFLMMRLLPGESRASSLVQRGPREGDRLGLLSAAAASTGKSMLGEWPDTATVVSSASISVCRPLRTTGMGKDFWPC